MPSLDVFKADAFSMASLTAAINAAPYQPKFLGSFGLFTPVPITTTTALVEKQQGKLAVLQTAPRGTITQVDSTTVRKVRNFAVPHIPANTTVRADDVQGVRAFGSETETETVAGMMNDKLVQLRSYHETTFEWHRLGALQGTILDADGSTIYNLFTEFSETEVSQTFELATATTDIKGCCTAVIRAMESALGSDTYGQIIGLCGDNFWDLLIAHPLVKEAYAGWNAAQMLMTQQRPGGFTFAGITFYNYRGNIGGTAWLDTDTCRFFPTGVMDLFQHIMAPGDMIETVNTRGQMIYAKQEIMQFGKGVEIHTQSNPLFLCTRPKVLIKGTVT